MAEGNKSIADLFSRLKKDGRMPTVRLCMGKECDGELGYPVYRGETEGGEYDEVLYVTESGRVLYGLVPCVPTHLHECPEYSRKGAEYLIARCNNDRMNQLPEIAQEMKGGTNG